MTTKIEDAVKVLRHFRNTGPAKIVDGKMYVTVPVDELDVLLTTLQQREAGAVEARAPVQGYHGETVPWRVHGLAWEAYAKKYGRSQSAKRLAERGGFGCEELDRLLPNWRDMAHAIDHPTQAASQEDEQAAWKLAGGTGLGYAAHKKDEADKDKPCAP